ncbi:hypothetical protein EDC04DRAFT_2870425 [Pisolithus marmoratus]|nr:hypothetical protein EDC04DRAFT_2870425 [Pisolithus marmoratus]
MWSKAHQERFEHHIANITASCGFPFNWVENQAVRNFLDELLPHATHVSSYQLTNCIVPYEVGQYQQLAKSTSRGCQATLQTDGWTGINFHHLVAFMATTVKCKVHTVQVVDVSAERRTAEHLKELAKGVIRDVQEEWGLEVVAMTSDASDESRAA